jgi:beta-lactam-binding protein with PASTA domain
MTLDPNGLIVQGTVKIDSYGNQPFKEPSTWTKASGSQIVVPNPSFYDQVATTRMFTFASLVLKVTNQESTTISPGTILSEIPAGGSIVAPGSTVDIVVAVAPPNQ